MACFEIFTSNRLEVLFEYLGAVLDQPLPSPLEGEMIVVQNKGMEQWLSLMLARRFGIWGNCSYLLPEEAIDTLVSLILPGLPDHTPFDPLVMTWAIMKHLPSCLTDPGFEGLSHFLGQEASTLKRLHLAEQIAFTFDQYATYRPEWVLDWEKGNESHWQARLWRRLARNSPTGHMTSVWKAFLEMDHNPALHSEALPIHSEVLPIHPEALPKRLSIFGIYFLPPVYLDILAVLARYLDVYLFLLNLGRELWFDLASERQVRRKQSERGPHGLPSLDSPLEAGHPLLASLGKQAAHFLERVLAVPHIEERAGFEEPGEETLLCCIQSDMLNLRDRGGGEVKTKMIAADDFSLQVHACPGPLREIEVLYDCLSDLFERKPGLQPGDILILMPDIELYAPFISAVFEGGRNSGKKIPYSLADRKVRKAGCLIETFLKILGLYGSRFSRAEVLDVLEARPVQRRFKLEEEDIGHIRQWIEDTRIHWGMDEQDRNRRGSPGFDENTWMAGLERLLLGYALPGKGRRMFGHILPYDHIEGNEAHTLGRLVECIHQLHTSITSLENPRTLTGWSTTLKALLDRFLGPCESSDSGREWHLIQRHLAGLQDIQEVSGFDEEIEIETVRSYLAHHLDREIDQTGAGFLTGAVTFGTMLPMRSIPHRVVAVVGLNQGEFPRMQRPSGFDLMAASPRKGDYSKRDEDRLLFLEILLSAREKVHISYVGQNIRNHSQIPPSAVVSELLETIERGFEHPKEKILDHVVTRHGLHAFGRGSFPSPGPPFSRTENNGWAMDAGRNAGRNAGKYAGWKEPPGKRRFITCPLPEPPEEYKTVPLNRFMQFYGNPAGFILRHRLGITLKGFSSSLNHGDEGDNREPFTIEGIDRYQVEQELVRRRLQEDNLEDHFLLVRALGILPAGMAGKVAYQDLCTRVERFAARVLPHLKAERERPPLEVDFQAGRFRITGSIAGLRPRRLIRYRCACLKAGDFLNIWIEHLLLNSCAGDEYPRVSLLIGRDGQWSFSPVRNSTRILAALLHIYWRGLSLPLPLFPATSLAYAEKMLTAKDPAQAMASARRAWEGSNAGRRGEAEDPYLQLCFGRSGYPLEEDFQELAMDIFKPLLNHRRKV